MRQVGTVLSSRDHPLMAAVDTFAGPVQQNLLSKLQMNSVTTWLSV